MSTPEHTRGPWKVISEAAAREVEVFEVAEVSHFRVICDGPGDGFDRSGDAFADACLIAAAPSMYEYIASSASNGCAEAAKILEAINGSR
jgi:hypothetical protein